MIKTCPRCGGIEFHKDGKSPYGNQIYKCKGCGKRTTFKKIGRPEGSKNKRRKERDA